jgi:hypothetical protein
MHDFNLVDFSITGKVLGGWAVNKHSAMPNTDDRTLRSASSPTSLGRSEKLGSIIGRERDMGRRHTS